MRGFLVMAMFISSLAHAGWSDYEEKRDLTLAADGIKVLKIKAGAGSMDVTGVEGLEQILVKALIVVPKSGAQDAQEVIENDMVLTLQHNGDVASLQSWFEQDLLGEGSYIVLDVSVPQGMSVDIDDGAGSLDIIDVRGDVTIEDGSGSIDVNNVANLKIDDGSGSIDVFGATGDVSIIDGSGSITVKRVQGSVVIDDGSGSIRVSDVERDLTIIDDGSGSQTFSNIRGTIDTDT
jgi:hypothetical protein